MGQNLSLTDLAEGAEDRSSLFALRSSIYNPAGRRDKPLGFARDTRAARTGL